MVEGGSATRRQQTAGRRNQPTETHLTAPAANPLASRAAGAARKKDRFEGRREGPLAKGFEQAGGSRKRAAIWSTVQQTAAGPGVMLAGRGCWRRAWTAIDSVSGQSAASGHGTKPKACRQSHLVVVAPQPDLPSWYSLDGLLQQRRGVQLDGWLPSAW